MKYPHMQRKLKSEKQKERDKKGKERIERFEKGNNTQTVESSVVKVIKDDGEYEDRLMVVYQKKNEIDGWQRIEIPYKKKKAR